MLMCQQGTDSSKELWPGPVLCSGRPGCYLGIAVLHWADSPWFIFVLHSQLFSPLLLSFQVFFKCSNINLIWEDKEEAWTFLWMYEEVGGCCNTQGYFQCFGLRNKSLPSAVRIHEMCLYSIQNPHQNIWREFRKLGMCHVQSRKVSQD